MKYDISKMKYEYKYYVPIEKMDRLRSMISPFVHQDKYMKEAGDGGYTVRSIYFDTPKYHYYHEKIDGLQNRIKLRIRGYNEYRRNNIVFLEIKRKHEKKIAKNRAPVYFSDLGDFVSGTSFKKYVRTELGMKNAIEDSRKFLFNLHRYQLLPTILVIYEREAYFGKFDKSLRLTFDKNLRGSIHPKLNALYQENHIRYSTPDHFVFEVKFYDIYPSWLKHINLSLGLRLGSFSKFTTCIDDHIDIRSNSRQLVHNFAGGLTF